MSFGRVGGADKVANNEDNSLQQGVGGQTESPTMKMTVFGQQPG